MVLHQRVAGKNKKRTPKQARDIDEVHMPRLLSVNVGLPRDVTWSGKTVRTGIWKSPVEGRRMVRKLNIVGDGQGESRLCLSNGVLSLLGTLPGT